MIITLDIDEQHMGEPIMCVFVNRETKTFNTKFAEWLTREQVEALQRQMPSMLEKAVRAHQLTQ